jgi:hypothetical protein
MSNHKTRQRALIHLFVLAICINIHFIYSDNNIVEVYQSPKHKLKLYSSIQSIAVALDDSNIGLSIHSDAFNLLGYQGSLESYENYIYFHEGDLSMFFPFDYTVLVNDSNYICTVEDDNCGLKSNCFRNTTEALSTCGRTAIEQQTNVNEIVLLISVSTNNGTTEKNGTFIPYRWTLSKYQPYYAAIPRTSPITVNVMGVGNNNQVMVDYEMSTTSLTFNINYGNVITTFDPLSGSVFTLMNYTVNNTIPVNTTLMSLNINDGIFIINSINYQVGFNPVFIRTYYSEYQISISITGTQIISSADSVNNVYFMLIDDLYAYMQSFVMDSCIIMGTVDLRILTGVYIQVVNTFFYGTVSGLKIRYYPATSNTIGVISVYNNTLTNLTISSGNMIYVDIANFMTTVDFNPIVIVSQNQIGALPISSSVAGINLVYLYMLTNDSLSVIDNVIGNSDSNTRPYLPMGIVFSVTETCCGFMNCTTQWINDEIPSYMLYVSNNITVTNYYTTCSDPNEILYCKQYCSPYYTTPPYCVIDPSIDKLNPHYGYDVFPSMDGLPAYCTDIRIKPGTVLNPYGPVTIDCSYNTNNIGTIHVDDGDANAAVTLYTMFNISILNCEGFQTSNIQYIATSDYQDVVLFNSEQTVPMTWNITYCSFSNYPRGIVSHDAVVSVLVDNCQFTQFNATPWVNSTITTTNRALFILYDDVNTPANINITNNVISEISYITFLEIRQSKGNITVLNNVCHKGCGWNDSMTILSHTIYADSDASLNFISIYVVEPMTFSRYVSIQNNEFYGSPVSGLVNTTVLQFISINPYHYTYSAVEIEGVSNNITFMVFNNVIKSFPTAFRLPDFSDEALATEYANVPSSQILKFDDLIYIREWGALNTIASLNMDIWRVTNAQQYMYTQVSNYYCQALCPAQVPPTITIDYCVVNPLDSFSFGFVYSDLSSAIENCNLLTSAGITEIQLAGGITYPPIQVQITGKWIKLRPQYVAAGPNTVAIPTYAEFVNPSTAVSLNSPTFTLMSGAMLEIDSITILNEMSCTDSDSSSTLLINSCSLSGTINTNNNRNLTFVSSSITGTFNPSNYQYLNLLYNSLNTQQLTLTSPNMVGNTIQPCSDYNSPCLSLNTNDLCNDLVFNGNSFVETTPSPLVISYLVAVTFQAVDIQCPFNQFADNTASAGYRSYAIEMIGPQPPTSQNITYVMAQLNLKNPGMAFGNERIIWDSNTCCGVSTPATIPTYFLAFFIVVPILTAALLFYFFCCNGIEKWSDIRRYNRLLDLASNNS